MSLPFCESIIGLTRRSVFTVASRASPVAPPCCPRRSSSDLRVLAFDRCLTFPDGVLRTAPPMLSECDSDTEPDPPETVDEGNTELVPPLRPEEVDTIRLGWVSGCWC